jgi:hypothetical protein
VTSGAAISSTAPGLRDDDERAIDRRRTRFDDRHALHPDDLGARQNDVCAGEAARIDVDVATSANFVVGQGAFERRPRIERDRVGERFAEEGDEQHHGFSPERLIRHRLRPALLLDTSRRRR